MAPPPVVNRGRLERLTVPDDGIKWNLNTFSIIFLVLVALALYKRYLDITRERQRFDTSGTSMV
jgi:hypothetical protein